MLSELTVSVMGDEEGSQHDFIGEMPANKKLTIYVIDGNESMFSGGQDCDFRRALKVVFHQVLSVCCSGSLNHMVGLVVTNTGTTKSRSQQRFSYEWIELGVPGREDALAIKELLDADDIHEAFNEKFGGHGACDLSNVVWSCKKIMSISATSFRHHMIMYLTNDPNPFLSDPAMFGRLERIVRDFCCTSYRDINGQRKVNKTPGEFHVLMLNGYVSDTDRQRWLSITANIFTGDSEELDLEQPGQLSIARVQRDRHRAYKRTFSQRAFSNISLEIGPGVKMAVSVYSLAAETRPPTRVLLDAETETVLDKRTFYVSKSANESTLDTGSTQKAIREEEDGESSVDETRDGLDAPAADDSCVSARSELKKAMMIGGELIVSDPKELEQLSRFDAKGIVVLGFKPIGELDLTLQLQPSQFLYPDDSSVRGSTRLYRALLERCLDRKMAIICRFCSRSNQKVRLVALLPEHKKSLIDSEVGPSSVDDESAALNDYRHHGFYVVFLPFAEDVRDVSDKMECPQGDWYRSAESDVDVSRRFIRNLTKPYLPENFYNPRLRSFNSMLIEAAVGERPDREDTLLPYHKLRSSAFIEKLTPPIIDHFQLGEIDVLPAAGSKRSGDSGGSAPKRSKKDEIAAMSIEEVARNGLLDSLTVQQLRAAIGETGCGKPPAGAKKHNLVAMLNTHFGC